MVSPDAAAEKKGWETATFAGGCFWCMEALFEALPGVQKVTPGYMGGITADPSYAQVSAGNTGHREVVQVIYDPELISYRQLLTAFWQQIDPTDGGGQFADRGSQYTSAIFYHHEEQRRVAVSAKEELARTFQPQKTVATEILKASRFYPAEEYHQHYYKKNPIEYERYKIASGRAALSEQAAARRLMAQSCGLDDSATQAKKKKLTPRQFEVTQLCGTEPPFNNAYWNNEHEGIYVDIVSGEPLFSSQDKFDSGTGWPSFRKALVPENIQERPDRRGFMTRTEVRSTRADSHLGHLFPDGPQPTGLRYCINSSALRFIPKEDLEKEGYGEYKKIFDSERNR